jgi:hypothetical protein
MRIQAVKMSLSSQKNPPPNMDAPLEWETPDLKDGGE